MDDLQNTKLQNTKLQKVKLQLGDIIQIISPNDKDLDDRIYYINYLDQNKIRLEEASGSETILTLTDGNLDNESITSIIIKSRAEEVGYARQNNLIIGVWVDIFFNGDLPLTLTGKITNLEEDKIEITTFPDNEVIFIDFAYKGIPDDLPIEKINLRKAPDVSITSNNDLNININKDQYQDGDENEMDIEMNMEQDGEENINKYENYSLAELEQKKLELQQSLFEIPDNELTDQGFDFDQQQKIKEQMRNYIFNADQIQMGEDLEEIAQMVDVPEEEQRYDIEKQLDDLLDDMLSSIPNQQRTQLVKNNIHKMIQRFKQLRDNFSIFDEKGYAIMPKSHGLHYKPLVEVMEKLDKQLYWALPVVKNIKKIYNLDDEDDGDDDVNEYSADDTRTIPFTSDYMDEKNIIDNYEKNNIQGEQNKYAGFLKKINPYLTPMLETNNTDDTIINTSVNSNINTIIDNLDNFESSVYGNDTFTSPHSSNKYERSRNVSQKRFSMQKYTIGTTGLDITKVRGENPIIKRKEITKNERLDIKSIMILPDAAVNFSRINLNTANILDKSNLNLQFLNYWQLLQKTSKINKTTVLDFNSSYNHNSEKFFKTFRNFVLGQKLNSDKESAKETDTDAIEYTDEDKEKYNKYLKTIIPNTNFLFNTIKPHLTGNLSINDILSHMEPFMVYQEDLNDAHYKEMKKYIDEQIIEYRKRYGIKLREYQGIKKTQTALMPSLIKIFDDTPNLRTKVLDVYGFVDTVMNMSNSDIIKRIYSIDNGVFYNNAIALISTNLMIADGARDMTDIDIYLNSGTTMENGITKPRKTGKTGKTGKETMPVGMNNDAGLCNKIKVIAKRYIELDELMEDNGIEIYFDKKYDPTNYSIGEMFKADSSMTTGEQITHYINKLTKNKGLNEISARRDAESIIKRKRTVEDGEYAILETTDESSATIQYYVRQNENWILDESIDSETFADDMNMFCNLNEKCISVKDKCEDQTTGANEIKKHNLKLLLSEFNTTLNINKDIIVNKIEDELARSDARIETLRNLRLSKMYKYEAKKIELGNLINETEKNVISPYDGLLNTILGQSDISKRYLDISKFVKEFTRESIEDNDESPYWLYCIKTNKKMLPTFIYKLATTFLTGGNFVSMLDKICALQGTISDDGDKYVDKYSGYTIKMINLNADEEYNEEGFKIITRAVMDDDNDADIIQGTKNIPLNIINPGVKQRRFATPDAKTIYNVIDALSSNMGINLDDQVEFVVRNVLKQLGNPNIMEPKSVYEKMIAKLASKGKPFDSYETAYNSNLLFLTFSYYLVAIQTSIPPIKTKTTFPGCKKSFSGFPVDGTDNMKGLTYIACVAFKIKNKAALPWTAISNRSSTFIAKQMEVIISKFILPTEDIKNNIKALQLYLSENTEFNIPEEHTVENWSNFLPPLKQLKISSSQDVGEVFKTRLSDSLHKGNKIQQEYISELQSKMIMFSFNIIDLIEKTINNKQALLKGKNGEPFIENACCEKSDQNTIRYFIKKQPEIAVLNNKIVRLGDMYADTQKLSKASILYEPRNTKRKLREIDNKFSENTIYRAFIVYCKFNSVIPLSDNLRAICPTKPDGFNINDSIEESIRKLKGNARNYNEQSLLQLLDIINNQNKTVLKIEKKNITNIIKLSEIMDKMDNENKRSSVFRKVFMDILDSFEINSLLSDTEQLRRFKNILSKLNDDMQEKIMEFISNFNTNIKNVNLKHFKECIETLFQFKEMTNSNKKTHILSEKEETAYKMINFMKKAMRSLTREFPNIIINAVKYDNVNAPTHWNLSSKHQNDVKEIIKGHYVDFNVFYNDKQIRMMMEKMIEMTSDMNELAQNTLFYSPVELITKQYHREKGSSDDTSSKKSDKYSDNDTSTNSSTDDKQKPSFKYSAFDLDLTSLLFKFYYLNTLTDLISLQNDKDILQVPLQTIDDLVDADESANRDNDFLMSKTLENDILFGNKTELSEKIANIIVSFTNLICKDKKAIDYNYKSLMDLILRAKEKEKDDITDHLKNMADEERAVDNLFKKHKLGAWSKGEQKGIHTYDTKTYDQEREDMENMALREAQLNKRNIVTNMNRDIYMLDAINEEAQNMELDREDNIITYMGEDAEPEEYDMDG